VDTGYRWKAFYTDDGSIRWRGEAGEDFEGPRPTGRHALGAVQPDLGEPVQDGRGRGRPGERL